MDVDERRKIRSTTIQPLPAAQIPTVVYGLNHLTGEIVARPSTSPGVVWTGDRGNDPNQIKRPGQVNLVQVKNFGSPNAPIYFTGPVRESGKGVNGLTGDPNPDPRLRKSTPGRYRE